MAYNQNKNPFQSKSPLNHNLKEKKTGTPYNHFHDPKSSKIYSSDQKVISGSNKFGTQSGRVKDDITGKRRSEEDYAREYASQLSSMYNSGQVTEGQFLADDLYKRNRKLSLKNGNLKLKSGYKGIDKGSMFNTIKGTANEDGGYTIPENQYTEDQIYDMMVQGGGLVSIVDGQIVSGNPNEVMGEGYDQKNRIRTDSDFRNQYEEVTQEDFEESNTRNSMSDEERKEMIRQKREKILAARAAKSAEENLSIEERKALLQEKREAILAARAAEGNSPVNNNSPLHQEQEIDPRTGQPKEGYEYIQSDPIIGETIEETIYNEDGSIKGTNRTTPTTINFDGTQVVENVEETPPSQPNDRPDFKEDCEGIVMNMGNFSKSGFYKCDTAPSPPGNITTPPGVIEEAKNLTDQYSTTTNKIVFTPVEPEPIPESASDLFNLSGGKIKKGGLKVDWDLSLPQFGPRFNDWVKNLSLKGKKCGNCDYLSR